MKKISRGITKSYILSMMKSGKKILDINNITFQSIDFKVSMITDEAIRRKIMNEITSNQDCYGLVIQPTNFEQPRKRHFGL